MGFRRSSPSHRNFGYVRDNDDDPATFCCTYRRRVTNGRVRCWARRVDKQRVIAIAVSGGGMLGTFLPWASAGGFLSVDGTRGDGWMTLVLFLGAIAISSSGERSAPMTGGRGFGVYLLSLGALAIALYDASMFANAADGIGVSVGSGLLLVISAAATVAFVASLSGPIVQVVSTVIVGALVTFAGFFHVAYGHSQPAKLCKKRQWSLIDTFVSVDDYIGKPVASVPPHLESALLACGAMRVDSAPSTPAATPTDAKPGAEFVGSDCRVPNAQEFRGRTAMGRCKHIDDCGPGFIYYSGFCRGPSNIVCCVSEP